MPNRMEKSEGMGFKGGCLRFFDNVVTPVQWRNLGALIIAAALGLSGCGGGTGTESGEAGTPFFGVVVADEPRAAEIGAEILARGGSAADAAVATYFALAVTYPSAASLGGGGVCLVTDPAMGGVASLSFPAPRAIPTPGAMRPTAVPANVRGIRALHARYGELDWRMVLAPAERMARLGAPVSRAAAQAYRAGGAKLLGDGEARRIFTASGRIRQENETLFQPDLADTLAQLRIHGAAALYEGALANELVAAVRQSGGTLSHEDLRNFAPVWQAALAVDFGNDVAFFAGPPAGAGLVAGQMWQMLAQDRRYRRASAGERPHLMAEAARRAFAGRTRWLADDGTTVDAETLLSEDSARAAMKTYDPAAASGLPSGVDAGHIGTPVSTGLIAVDLLGGAVACNFTAYEPFGTGAVAPGTGVLIAPAPGPDQRNPLSLGPMLVVNPFIRSFKFAAVGGDGPAAPAALTGVAAETLLAGRRLDEAIRQSRVAGGTGRTVLVEGAAGDESVAALRDRGHDLLTVPALGHVNAVYCPSGYPAEESKILCWAEADPRGYGLTAVPR